MTAMQMPERRVVQPGRMFDYVNGAKIEYVYRLPGGLEIAGRTRTQAWIGHKLYRLLGLRLASRSVDQ